MRIVRILALIALLAPVSSAFAVDRLVPSQYSTIQSAINAAQSGDTVLVNPGTYNERLNFLGKAIRLKGKNGYAQTVLDPLGGGDYLLTAVTNETLSTVVEGFTFRSSPTGGLRVANAGLTVLSCRFLGNANYMEGGAFLGDAAVVNFSNCQFNSNTANLGGAIRARSNSQITLANCIFNGNSSRGGRGGAIYCNSSSLTLQSCQLLNNSELEGDESYGGAIALASCSGLIEDCVFNGNKADSARWSYGGSIYLENSSPTVRRTQFSGCVARVYRGDSDIFACGGSVYGVGATSPMFEDCTWTSSTSLAEGSGASYYNSVSTWAQGGAIYLRDGCNPRVVRCQFMATKASSRGGGTVYGGIASRAYGGAIWIRLSSAYFEDCTIDGCISESSPSGRVLAQESFGGAIWCEERGSPTVATTSIQNCSAMYGGALAITGRSAPFMSTCSLVNNTGSTQGGVLYSIESYANFADSLFQGNHSPSGSVAWSSSSTSLYPAIGTSVFCGNDGTDMVGTWYNDPGNIELDTCPEDCNNNGKNDRWEILAGLAADCNGNNTPDECDLAAQPGADCNHDGIIDSCQSALPGFGDCDGNGVADACEPDCNGDGIADVCQIRSGAVLDCNSNGIPDACDIASGRSTDCDHNGIPDSCQADCDHDGTPDACEIATGASDCNSDGIPDACQLSLGDANRDGVLDACQTVEFQRLVTEIVPISSEGLPSGAVCYRVWVELAAADSRLYGFYGNAESEMRIAAVGGFWQSPAGGDMTDDIDCVLTGAARYDSWLTIGQTCNTASEVHPLYQAGMDFNAFNAGGAIQTSNGIVFVDPEATQGRAGPSRRVLIMQITTNAAVALTGKMNLVGENADHSNWQAFAVPIPAPTLIDCNGNGVHDALDIASGTSSDCDHNGVPDECGAFADCNHNGVLDACDIASGVSGDLNSNGVPDECECVADIDGNGSVDVMDLVTVLLSWGDPAGSPADIDRDGTVGTGDLALVLLFWGSC